MQITFFKLYEKVILKKLPQDLLNMVNVFL